MYNCEESVANFDRDRPSIFIEESDENFDLTQHEFEKKQGTPPQQKSHLAPMLSNLSIQTYEVPSDHAPKSTNYSQKRRTKQNKSLTHVKSQKTSQRPILKSIDSVDSQEARAELVRRSQQSVKSIRCKNLKPEVPRQRSRKKSLKTM